MCAGEQAVLATGGASGANLPQFFLWLGLLIGTVVILTTVLLVARRRWLREERGEGDAGVFEQLRVLRTKGEITDAEFELARQRLIARVRGEDPGARPEPPGTLKAPAGFDLTGDALPSPGDDRESR